MTRLKIYAAGFNSHGQLGVGEEGNDKHTFTECMLEPDVDIEDFETLQVKICSGAVHTLLLISHDGKKDLYMAGCSKKGQLGMITQTNMRRFTLRSTEDILHQVDPLHQPRIPGYIRQPQDIAAGWETSFILFSDPGQNDTERNSLAMLGSNEYRQLMSADKNVTAKVYRNYNRIIVVKQIVSGPLHTMMIGDNGQIRGWGFNCSQISPSVPPRANAIMTVPINMHFQLGPDDLAEETIALGIRHTCIVAPQQPYALFGDDKAKLAQ
jgi:alpha-tubulin suppressor-like RCC1 family protein